VSGAQSARNERPSLAETTGGGVAAHLGFVPTFVTNHETLKKLSRRVEIRNMPFINIKPLLSHKVQWSLYVPHSGHYMYHTVVTICTAQLALYVPRSGHYMYRTVVNVCTAQWSL